MMPDTFSDAHERDGEVPSAPGAHQAACAEYLVIWVCAGHQQGATAKGPKMAVAPRPLAMHSPVSQEKRD